MTPDQQELRRALDCLKDFQRRTVEYVFKRMWLDEPAAERFLVADEVGLGKTLVARGIIARTIEKLAEDGVGRIDVVYVCSNAAIAQQNVNRLSVLKQGQYATASRLTLLPIQLHEMEKNRVNFVSFTPGTTFDLKSAGGIWKERVLLFHLLAEEFWLPKGPLLSILRGEVRLDRFEKRVQAFSDPINRMLADEFREELKKRPGLREELTDACRRFARPRTRIPPEDRALQYSVIGQLRDALARVCVHALEPDLVILDEFQRFRDLLDGQSQAAELARSLMHYTTPEGHGVRVLLLSATPYKPLTFSSDEEDHYRDFLRTLGFLFHDPAKVARVEELLRIYRRGMYDGGDEDVPKAREALETLLRSVMVRTERVGRTRRKDAMLATVVQDAPLSVEALGQARLLSTVATQVGSHDPVEYWKSAPHVLPFMRDYQLKSKLIEVSRAPPAPLVDALVQSRKQLLSQKQVVRYREIGGDEGRLRVLLDEMLEKGQWKLLWMPPSLPYLTPGGVYAEVPEFTKALVFSSWNVVPSALSALCSYEAERRMIQHGGKVPGYNRLLTARKPLLRFSESRGRLTGMPTLALMYPSLALSRAVDPLGLALELGEGRPAPPEEVKRAAREAIGRVLPDLQAFTSGEMGLADQRWYWVALAILDRPYLKGLRPWLRASDGWSSTISRDDDDKGVTRHIELFLQAAEGALDGEMGPVPDDLVDVLTELALGSPAICGLRALRRVAPALKPGERPLSHAAATMGGAFRTLFNLPESIAMLRGEDEGAYWRLVLHQGIDGNLQAVLDEYAHQLKESLGLLSHGDADVAQGIAGETAEALSLRTAPVLADDIGVTPSGAIRFRKFRFRTRFALRFGDLRDDQDKTLARVGTVRAAFNSPFRPFVLATTSVGQEGLDFHPYCHAVYHWNLPSNPVDLEQREGRVHRYKGHAVRKNLARKWGLGVLRERLSDCGDPWQVLFNEAASQRPPEANELEPYWIYPVPGGASVERRVPMFPLSRETGWLAALQRGLALYRLAFGQPRQEDLLVFLAGKEEGEERGYGEPMEISLEPPGEG